MDSSLYPYIIKALEELDGANRFVAGATVASVASRLSAAQGINFREQLRSAGLKFGDVVRALSATDQNVRLQMREGADLLLGFASAESEQPLKSRPGRIRRDFYDAFTRFGQPQMYYHRDRDEVSDEVTDFAIPFPTPSGIDAIRLRREFTQAVPSDVDKRRLEGLLNDLDPARSISQFSREITSAGLADVWRAFLYQHVRSLIEAWAMKHGLIVRKEWFEQPGMSPRGRKAPLQLRDLIASLTDDELENVLIPAKILAVMLSRRSKS